jgi:hypothetical protein
MEQEELYGAAKELGLVVQDQEPLSRQWLTDRINEWLQTDFEKLVAALYRIDVDEDKLRSLLSLHPGQDAAEIITGLILERQLQKIKSRQQFRSPGWPVDENEKW